MSHAQIARLANGSLLPAVLALCAYVSASGVCAQTADPSVHDSTTSEEQLHDALHRTAPEDLPPGVKSRGGHPIGDRTASENPKVALSINFAFGSAEILPDSRELLLRLAQAMNEGDLKGDHFEIVGHTDAAGRADANMKLSMARATAVRDDLVNAGGIAPERLSTIGKGESEPLNQSDPYAAENRRVEIINIGPR